jgi:hypothetical protein
MNVNGRLSLAKHPQADVLAVLQRSVSGDLDFIFWIERMD